MRSGRYLGNNTMQLIINNASFQNVDYTYQTSNTSIGVTTTSVRNFRVDYMIMHDVRLSFQAGGVVQAFY